MDPTEQRHIGKTPLKVTQFGLGGTSIGNLFSPVSEETAHSVIRQAWELGIRYFDTAPVYGLGLSERRFGDMLRDNPREEFVLTTKVGKLLRPICEKRRTDLQFACSMPFEVEFDYSFNSVMRSFEDSLQRLGMSQVDILLLHDLDSRHGYKWPRMFQSAMDGGYRALDQLRCDGVIKAVGLGVNEWEVCESAMQYGDFDCFLLAGRYTLLEQGALETFLPKCSEKNISIILGSPFNSGILAGGEVSGNMYNYKQAPPEIIERVAKIEDVCRSHGVEMAAAALQFPLFHPRVATVIPGSRSPEELRQNMEWMKMPIPESLWSDLKNEGLMREDAPVKK